MRGVTWSCSLLIPESSASRGSAPNRASWPDFSVLCTRSLGPSVRRSVCRRRNDRQSVKILVSQSLCSAHLRSVQVRGAECEALAPGDTTSLAPSSKHLASPPETPQLRHPQLRRSKFLPYNCTFLVCSLAHFGIFLTTTNFKKCRNCRNRNARSAWRLVRAITPLP